MDGSMVAVYLEPYGYEAAGPEEWRATPSACRGRPSLTFKLDGHSESEKHTFYSVKCRLTAEVPALCAEWPVQRRLVQLREGLHDLAKMELGKHYNKAFSDAPFAKKGGPRGTSERVNKWLQTLAACVNEGTASPALVAQVLLFLEAPAQAAHHTAAESVAGAEQSSVQLDIPAESNVCEGIQAGEPAAEQEPAAVAGGRDALVASRPVKEADLPQAAEESEPAAGSGTEESEAAEPALPTDKSTAESPQRQEIKGAEPACKPAVEGPCVDASPRSRPEPWTTLSQLSPMDPEAGGLVAKFLEPLGYVAASPDTWGVSPAQCPGGPMLSLGVNGHAKVGKKTNYAVQCRLSAASPLLEVEWSAQLQLAELRESLHDVAKKALGSTYAQAFGDVPFAKMGGPPGTTERLHRWLGGLAACVNAGVARPALVAHVLALLKPPFVKKNEPAAKPDPRAPAEEPPAVERRRTLKVPEPVHTDVVLGDLKELREAAQVASPSGYDSAPEGGATDDEGTAWSQEKRRAGYKKLQEWFKELRKALERKVKGDLSPRLRGRSRSPAKREEGERGGA